MDEDMNLVDFYWTLSYIVTRFHDEHTAWKRVGNPLPEIRGQGHETALRLGKIQDMKRLPT
eukprot:scaffold131372_cov32-Prasinocladus_malaysianus.AAC.1